MQVVQTLEQTGMPVDRVAQLITSGAISLELLDEANKRVFSACSDTTFAQAAERTGIPIETLLALRVATGVRSARARSDRSPRAWRSGTARCRS